MDITEDNQPITTQEKILNSIQEESTEKISGEDLSENYTIVQENGWIQKWHKRSSGWVYKNSYFLHGFGQKSRFADIFHL